MKLLITGIPGTGKTSIGNYLQSSEGYDHLDIEAVFKTYDIKGMEMVNDFLKKPGTDKVISWGFRPETDDGLVEQLQHLGYNMIWFDGDREAARRAFLKRGTVQEYLFDLQIDNIDKWNLKKFDPIKVNTFSENGEFLSKKSIIKLIIASIGH